MAAEPELDDSSNRARTERMLGILLVVGCILAPATYLFVDLLMDTLKWRYERDTAVMIYMSWLMDEYGFLPWRDFFDMNWLGSYLSYLWIGRYFGWDDAGIRMADAAVLVSIMVFTGVALWRLGLRVLWGAGLLFAFRYLSYGTVWTLQREILAMVPVSLGLACATALPRLPTHYRAWLAGLCFGIAATIKPHFVLPMPFIVFYLVAEQIPEPGRYKEKFIAMIQLGLMGAAGMILPLLGFLGYLVYYGLLDDFLDTVPYLQYYGQITSNRLVLSPEQRDDYLIKNTLDMVQLIWVPIGVVGLIAGLSNELYTAAQRRIVQLLSGVIIAYAIYPVISGHFWQYHFLPLEFALSLTAALVFAPYKFGVDYVKRFAPLIVVLVVCAQQFQPHNQFHPLYKHKNQVPRDGRPDQISKFLNARLEPGDTVQPLDWAGGGMVHGMFYAQAKIATKFIYYFHFFHHVDTEYIQDLKVEFMNEMEEAKPRFLLRGMLDVPGFVRGRGTAHRFHEMEAYIARNYRPVYRGRSYLIYERKSDEAIAEEEATAAAEESSSPPPEEASDAPSAQEPEAPEAAIESKNKPVDRAPTPPKKWRFRPIGPPL